MSEPRRVLLAGATGLVGTGVIEAAREHPSIRLVALSRRESPIPRGTRMEMMVADPAGWPEAIAAIGAEAAVCALGTTLRKAGSEAAFRAVDHDLVVTVARAAREAGVSNFVLVSSAGADPHARSFYLRVKGEVETAVAKLGFRRLDILRPGLLRGKRSDDWRLLERVGIVASPLVDLFLQGQRRRYRSIAASAVAAAALGCSGAKAGGRFVHDNEAIARLARRFASAG